MADLDVLYAQVDEIVEAARAAGWQHNLHVAETGSCYLTLVRPAGEYDVEYEEYQDSEDLVIRIADHGECYCREDYSVDPTGLTVEQVRAIVTRERGTFLKPESERRMLPAGMRFEM